MAPEQRPGARPMLLDTFAVTGGTPKANKVGNVIRVPEPYDGVDGPGGEPG